MRNFRFFSLLLVFVSGCTGVMAFHGRAVIDGPRFQAPPPPETTLAFRAEVQVDFFGVPLDNASDVVFVLDRSGSMGLTSFGVAGKDVGMSKGGAAVGSLAGTILNAAAGHPLPSKMAAVKTELARTLSRMPDGTRFDIVFFDDELAAFSPSMVVLTPESRAAALAFLHGIDARGSTAAVPAMRLAYQIHAARVVLLSDGLPNTGGGAGELMAEARSQIAQGLRIDTVGVGLDQDDALLRTLAYESGGLAITR
jgi:hypothetical protein